MGFRGWLLVLFGVALAIRLVLVAVTDGSFPDLQAFAGVNAGLRTEKFEVYSAVNDPGFTWPYPPLYFPVVLALFELAELTGVGFERLVRLPQVAGDLAIAWVVQWHLGWRGASERVRLIAVGLLLLNPAMIAFSSMHGQVDPLEWLPVLLAIVAWERLPEGRRAPAAGLLIGVGIALKTAPGVALLALVPLATTWRERGVLVAAAGLIPAALFAPFAVADLDGVRTTLDYAGVPGQGGLSMLFQPDLTLARYAGGERVGPSGLQELLQDVAPVAVILGLAGTAVLIARRKPDPAAAVVALILCVFVLGANFLTPYVTWLLPFAVLAGWNRFVVIVTACALVPLFFRYAPSNVGEALGVGPLPFDRWAIIGLYIPAAAALWLAFTAKLAHWTFREG